MDLYRELILDHYHHPRNFGHIESPDGLASDNNVSCGDSVTMEVSFDDASSTDPIIKEVRFSGSGCAINQASASLLTEKVIGRTRSQVLALSVSDIFELLGTSLTPARVKCALLPLEVLQKAIMK